MQKMECIFHGSAAKARFERDEKARLDREREARVLLNNAVLDAAFQNDSYLRLYVTPEGELVDQRFKDRLHHGPETFFHYTPLENIPKMLEQGVRADEFRKYNFVTKGDWKEFVPMHSWRRIGRLEVRTNWSFHIYPHAEMLNMEWVTSHHIPPEDILKVEFSGIFNITDLSRDRIEDICKSLEGVASKSIASLT